MKAKNLCIIAFIAIFVSCNNKNEKIDTTEIIADSLMTEQQPDSVIEMGRIGIKMQKISGVYSLPALVNGVKMNLSSKSPVNLVADLSFLINSKLPPHLYYSSKMFFR